MAVKATSFLPCIYGCIAQDGLVTLAGVGLDRVDATLLPVSIAFNFFARVESEFNDLPGRHTAELTFMGEDRTLGRTGVEFWTTEDKRNTQILINMAAVFEAPGSYRFELTIDGRAAGSWPLEIRLAGASEGTGAPPP